MGSQTVGGWGGGGGGAGAGWGGGVNCMLQTLGCVDCR